MATFTKTRRTEAQREYRLACGHKQYGRGGIAWKSIVCCTCGETTRAIGEQGPKSLEDLFKF